MLDKNKPGHLRKDEIELYEVWYKEYPFDLYRAFMQSVAEFYIKVGKGDPVEDLDKAIQILQILKEKEIEHASNSEIRTLEKLLSDGYKYLARDSKKSWTVGGISAYAGKPQKCKDYWVDLYDHASTELLDEEFTEVKWEYDEPTRIDVLLAFYQNGGNDDSSKVLDESVSTLKQLQKTGYSYLARDRDYELWAYEALPTKGYSQWTDSLGYEIEEIKKDVLPEVKWEDDMPTRIVDLLETYLD